MPKLEEEDLNLDVLPDPADFRDKLFEPTLVEVPPWTALAEYRAAEVPVLNQGGEGSCTGHALATVANFLLRQRSIDPDPTPTSPRMFYEMAKRYDEWEGEDYSGSSARGSMKGWHKHGVCSLSRWSYESGERDRELSAERAASALKRPLGAYYRVNHKDLVAMHCALAEVKILFATAVIHTGWLQPRDAGIPAGRPLGGHAFAIVAYDRNGFWVQNSWGTAWGEGGLALLSYDDWLENGMDVWVGRLGVPLHLKSAPGAAIATSATAARSAAFTFDDLRSHIVSVGNDGKLRTTGTYASRPEDVRRLFREDLVAVSRAWRKRRILIYAHGGLVSEASAVQRVAEYRAALLEAEVYPVAFVWKTDFWSTLVNILRDALHRRRPEGAIEKAKEFLLDRLDDALEPLARALGGRAQWAEMKENALLATSAEGRAGRLVLDELTRLAGDDPSVEIHLAAHSAGSIFLAPFTQLLTARGAVSDGPLRSRTGHGVDVGTCTLWAPACTTTLFKQCYLPAIREGAIASFALYNLTDHSERDDDCGGIYNKSLLYLVSHALEETVGVPSVGATAGVPRGTPLLGMERFVGADDELARLFAGPDSRAELVLAPNNYGSDEATAGDRQALRASRARHHGDFDDDVPTVRSTLARILGPAAARRHAGKRRKIDFESSAERMSARRRRLAD
jgi:hypothetical protein